LEQSKEWLEGDGFNSTRGAYSEKIDRINAKVLPIKQRHDNLNHTTEEFGNFYACLDSNFQFLNSLVNFLVYFRKQSTLTLLPKRDKNL
jgi:hypothetical protein